MSASFKAGLREVLRSVGFSQVDQVLVRKSSEVAVLIGFQKNFGQQWFVNVGFWIFKLGSEMPTRVEDTHLYFRLERLFPSQREIILLAGDLKEEGQPAALEELKKVTLSTINKGLADLETLSGLETAMRANRLSHGLVKKEAQSCLM